MTPRQRILTQIAKQHLLIPTLKTRRADSLDFHETSVWAVEAALDAAFEGGQKSIDTKSLDLSAILAERHQIAVIWSTEDVREVRPDLTEDQAWQVLQNVERTNDASLGITWEMLAHHAELLFGGKGA